MHSAATSPNWPWERQARNARATLSAFRARTICSRIRGEEVRVRLYRPTLTLTQDGVGAVERDVFWAG